MSSKHLATGSTLPPAKDGILRIYSMRFCPYAQRALLVADAKGIPHDVVNANLKQKPEWLLERNPAGKVPTIDTPKGSLYESLVVADYLDEVYPTHPLNSPDPFQRALDRIWIENFSNIVSKFYKVLMNKDDMEIVKTNLKELFDGLETFNKELERRGTLFFGGADKPGMLDYMIWPWVERLPIFKLTLPAAYDYDAAKKQHPKLEKWRQAMKEDPAVKANFLTPEIHHKFIVSHFAGSPDYDILEK
jgi:glutathione S-transferase